MTVAAPPTTAIFPKTKNGAFGFLDENDKPIPTFLRNQPISLNVEPNDPLWNTVESVTLTNFRAFTGPPPWQPYDESWDDKHLSVEKGSTSPAITLDTQYKGGHRMIVFDVTVRKTDGCEFTYVDPWDESPG